MVQRLTGPDRRRRGAVGLVLALLASAVLALGGGGIARAERDITRLCPEHLAQRTTFTDVTPGSTHALGIYCIAELGITLGTTETTYTPNGAVRRGQMATFLLRLLNGSNEPVPPVNAGGPPDIQGHTHALAIRTLIGADVIPYSGGNFRPNDPIRRDDMAAWMNGTWEWVTGTRATASGQPFHDVAGNPWAADIAGLYVYGVINGKASGYDPGGAVTRAQMGSFIARLASMHGDAGHLPNFPSVTTTTIPPTTSTTQAAPAPSGIARVPSAESEVLAHHNAARSAQGLGPLVRNACLDQVASEWAQRMATDGTPAGMYHRTAADIQARTSACLPSWTAWAENIGGQTSVSAMTSSWMGSSGHRANILHPSHNRVGIGVWRAANGTLWFAVNFASA